MSEGIIELTGSKMTIRGEVTLVDARALYEQLEQKLAQVRTDLVVDLAGLEKFDSTICLLLIACYRLLKKTKHKLDCVNIPSSLHDIFSVYDLHEVLPFLKQK